MKGLLCVLSQSKKKIDVYLLMCNLIYTYARQAILFNIKQLQMPHAIINRIAWSIHSPIDNSIRYGILCTYQSLPTTLSFGILSSTSCHLSNNFIIFFELISHTLGEIIETPTTVMVTIPDSPFDNKNILRYKHIFMVQQYVNFIDSVYFSRWVYLANINLDDRNRCLEHG